MFHQDVVRELGISEATFYNSTARYGGMEVRYHRVANLLKDFSMISKHVPVSFQWRQELELYELLGLFPLRFDEETLVTLQIIEERVRNAFQRTVGECL